MSFRAARVESLRGQPEQWHYVGTTNDFDVTFENSWANQGGGATPARFYKDQMGRVYVEGVIDTGVSGTTAFTLPVGYRPDYITSYIVSNNSGGPGPGGAYVRVNIYTTGAVQPDFTGGTNIRLDGVNFRAD